MTLDVQLQTMIVMIVGGIYLGISLDTYRRFSPYWKKKPILKYVLECCFWLSQTLILFYALYLVNQGELRLYVFAACLLGFAIYQVAVASLYKRLLERIIRTSNIIGRLIITFIKNIFIKPIKWLVFVLLSLALFFIRLIVTAVLFFYRPVYKMVKHLMKAIYQRLPNRNKKILFKFAGFYSTIENRCKKWFTYLTFKRR